MSTEAVAAVTQSTGQAPLLRRQKKNRSKSGASSPSFEIQKSSELEKKSEVKAAKEGSGIEETKVAPSGDVALTKTLVDVVNGMKGNGKASPKAAPASNEGNRQAKGQQQKVEKKPAPVINKPAPSAPQQMKKPEPEKKEKIELKFEDVQRRDQQAAQRKKVVSAPAPVSSMPVQTLATQLAGMRLGVVEYVDIPEALEDWATHKLDECNAILAQVKERSDVMSVVVEHGSGSSIRVAIMATSEDQARRAKSLLEIHLKNQETLARTEKRLQKVQSDISAVQGEVAAGLRIEFNILPELTGIVIGKKGEHIKRVYDETGVTKIDVNEGVVRLVGPSIQAVTKAREMLEFQQVDVELEAEVQQWLTRPMLGDVKDKSECAIVRLVDKQVRMIGTKKQVEDAKLLLETQIEYITKHQELRANEDKMRQRLIDMEAAYGVNRPGGNGMRQGKRMDEEYNESQGDGNGDFTRDEESNKWRTQGRRRRQSEYQKDNRGNGDFQKDRGNGYQKNVSANGNSARGPTLRDFVKKN